VSTPGTQQALEDAIAAEPDDPAPRLVYADWLEENGEEARAELIRTQVALADTKTPARRHKKLFERQEALLEEHARRWLGDLAPYLLDQKGGYYEDDRAYDHNFAGGWLALVRVERLTPEFVRALKKEPAARLLRSLEIVDVQYRARTAGLSSLKGAHFLKSLREVWVGASSLGPDESIRNAHFPLKGSEVDVIRGMHRLEELHLFTQGIDTEALFGLRALKNLRVLQVYCERDYPLEALAANPSLGSLTRLDLQPGTLLGDEPPITVEGLRALVSSPHLKGLTELYLHLTAFGDAGCEEIVRSGILKRLKSLDLSYGAITDAGARLLAASPDVRNLEWLCVSRNGLTRRGIRALEAVVPSVSAGQQHRPGDDNYLYEGDIE
jgi:uncharacterized protein (TIGR02996 family)